MAPPTWRAAKIITAASDARRDDLPKIQGVHPIAPVGIVVALGAEARSCAGWQRASNARVILAGPGLQRAEQGAMKLVEQGVSCLISWGTSGALVPDLGAGQLLVLSATSTVHGPKFQCDLVLLGAATALLAPLAPLPGAACSVGRPASGPEGKLALASCGALSVDMETAAIAGVAAKAGVRFLGIRAIVDPLQCEIPAAAFAGMGEDGHSHPMRVLAALLRRPGDLPALIRLAGNYSAALRTLSRAAGLLGAAVAGPVYAQAFTP